MRDPDNIENGCVCIEGWSSGMASVGHALQEVSKSLLVQIYVRCVL